MPTKTAASATWERHRGLETGRRGPHLPLGYAVAFLSPLLTVVLRQALDPVLHEHVPLLLFILPVFVSAWFGGLGPGLLSTGLSLALGNFFFLEPRQALGVLGAADGVRMTIFFGEGVLISALSQLVHSHRTRADARLQELQESEERFRLLVDGAKDYAMLLLDPSGHVVGWNRGAERSHGYREDEVLGCHFSMFFTAEDVRAGLPERELREAASQGRAEDDNWLVRKDGSRFWASGVSTPVYDEGGSLRGFAKIVRDISERKRWEDELEERVRERTAQLEEAYRELETFSYSVSHDLRTPLRGIGGFSQLLLEDYGDRLDTTARDYLGRIQAGAEHMGRLIEDVLHLARVSRQELRCEPIDLSALAQGIADRLRRAAPERRVDFVCDERVTAAGDAKLLAIALENLLENAWKFTAQKEAARIEFRAVKQGSTTAYCVSDNGAGFDMRYGDKLFLPFQRLHAEHEFEGSGVGLATVQRVIERHGGRVWAKGEPGKGARFCFTLGESPAPESGREGG